MSVISRLGQSSYVVVREKHPGDCEHPSSFLLGSSVDQIVRFQKRAITLKAHSRIFLADDIDANPRMSGDEALRPDAQRKLEQSTIPPLR